MKETCYSVLYCKHGLRKSQLEDMKSSQMVHAISGMPWGERRGVGAMADDNNKENGDEHE